MKTFFYKTGIFALTLMVVLGPTMLFAAQGGAGLVQCGNPGQPSCNFAELIKLFNRVVNAFLGISVSIAAITFAIAGGRILFSPDKPAEREKAKDMFKKSILGLIIIMIAWLAVRALVGALINPATGALRFIGS